MDPHRLPDHHPHREDHLVTRSKQHQHRPPQRPAAARPGLPRSVTPELVTALAALARLGDAWREYEAATAVAMNAASQCSLAESHDRRARVSEMLPGWPSDAIEAAGRNVVVLAALQAAARTDGGAR
jgi:hypothetical protein